MATTRDRGEPKRRLEGKKSLIINTEVGRENSTVFRERTRTMTTRRDEDDYDYVVGQMVTA